MSYDPNNPSTFGHWLGMPSLQPTVPLAMNMDPHQSHHPGHSGSVMSLDGGDARCSSSQLASVMSLDQHYEAVPPARMVHHETKRKHHETPDYVSSKKTACDQMVMHEGLLEEDVGIHQYVSSTPGFTAIIKQRYSDFHVNEIDLQGNVARLSSLELPPEKEVVEEIYDRRAMLSILSEEQLKSIEELTVANDNSKSVLLNVSSLNKAERKKIHTLLKTNFKQKIFSNTIEKGKEKFIEIGSNAKIDDRCNRLSWTEGEYLHFILHKENMDHSQVVGLLAHLLKIKPNFISAAGTKDKRAKTSQWMSVRRVKADRLSKFRLKSMWCGHYCYKKEPLRLGDLKGNLFRIALRNVTADDDLISEAMNSVKQRGFINYYGLQRFGSSVVAPTHLIGQTLLERKWKEAVELILKPRPKEKGDSDMGAAREAWWNTRNAKHALRLLRNPMKSIEGKLLLSLDRLGPNAYINALESLPRTTAMLYVHSYQSYVWNKILSRRIQEFGLAPIVGDLVVADDVDVEVECSSEELLTEAFIDPESEVTEESRTVMDKNTHSFQNPSSLDLNNMDPQAAYGQPAAELTEKENGVPKEKTRRKVNVKKLKQEDLPNYSMTDIVYPLPGFDVEYPDNIIQHWYEDTLAADDLTIENFRQSVKLFSTPGSYRKMLCIPKGLSWKIMRYKSENDCLIMSDVEQLKGLPHPKSDSGGAYKGITMEMSLPSCSYATMCLREITKMSTSVSAQAALTAKAMSYIIE